VSGLRQQSALPEPIDMLRIEMQLEFGFERA